jgi:DNA-binding transcriptional MerR regulator
LYNNIDLFLLGNESLMSDQSVLFPIRELSELTQVNTVTIRAWERRYGLLIPQRTAKGHRLYSQEDVKRVKAILTFISKGVPVSKVKALLAQESILTQDEIVSENNSDWSLLMQQLESTLASNNLHKIRAFLRELFLNYPVDLCHQKIIGPTSKKLVANKLSLANAAVLHSAIIEYSILRLNTKAAKKSGEKVVLICAEQGPVWQLALTAIALNDANFCVTFFNQSCSLDTWLALTEQHVDSTCIVFQEGVWRGEDCQKIQTISEQQNNLLFCGTAAAIADIDPLKRVTSPDKILCFLTGKNSL